MVCVAGALCSSFNALLRCGAVGNQLVLFGGVLWGIYALLSGRDVYFFLSMVCFRSGPMETMVIGVSSSFSRNSM